MDKVILYQEYRLIERSETEINGAWKGVHLILFFLAFVFGCSCTFSFHILMYLFDEKCVLFPKLLSLREMRQSVIYEFMPLKNEHSLPVDFVSTQWTESSTCYLPTYVPLVSGIFGLVWTTMFLMCSSGNRTMTGLQRPWRILLPVFIFSVAMGSLSVYTSYITHSGLQDLCEKLSEVTGSKTCAYTVNIVTLAYERRIRGVYQATRLTILTAWMHTFCWLLAAVVALARVLLVIDFRLVRIQAELQGNIEEMLEHHEQHIRTISPEILIKDDTTSTRPDTVAASTGMSNLNVESSVTIRMDNDSAPSQSRRRTDSVESVKVRFLNKAFNTNSESKVDIDGTHYISVTKESRSGSSLVPIEAQKLARLKALRSVTRNNRFIAKMVFDLLNRIDYASTSTDPSKLSSFESFTIIGRQPGKIASLVLGPASPPSTPKITSETSLQQTTWDTSLQPTIWEPSLQPTTQETSLQPTMRETSLQPTTRETSLQPKTRETSQQPKTRETSQQPTTQEKSLQQTTRETSLQPTTREKSLQPTTREKSLQQTTRETSLQPTTQETSLQPTTWETSLQPITTSLQHDTWAFLSDQESVESLPKGPSGKSSRQGLTISNRQKTRRSRKNQRKLTEQEKINKGFHKELMKRLNKIQGHRTGTIIVPRTSPSKPREGFTRPKVTQSERLAPRSSARSITSRTTRSAETAIEASDENSVPTDSVPSIASPVTLQSDSFTRLKYSLSEKTLTPEVVDVSRYTKYHEDDSDKMDRTESNLSQRKGRLLDDQDPGPSKPRKKSDNGSQTDYKKEKQD